MADVLKGLEIKNMTDVSADLYFYGDIVSDWWEHGRTKISTRMQSRIFFHRQKEKT